MSKNTLKISLFVLFGLILSLAVFAFMANYQFESVFYDYAGQEIFGIEFYCRPPCWNKITPGKTTFEETLVILENSALTETLEVYEYEMFIEAEVNLVNVYGEVERVFFTSESPDLVVYEIYAQVNDSKLTLEEIIEVYDPPSHITFGKNSSSIWFSELHWVDLGMKVNCVSGDEPGIYKDSDVGMIHLMTTDDLQEIQDWAASEGEPGHQFVPWSGYGAYHVFP